MIEQIIDYSNEFHISYLEKRHLGIKNILLLSKMLNYSSGILFKAIQYLDKIYLRCKMPLKQIDEVSTICLLISLKFNDSHRTDKRNLYQVVHQIDNYRELEVLCLKALDYELMEENSFDLLSNYLSNVNNFLFCECEEFLTTFICDKRALDFSPLVLSLSIMKIMCTKYNIYLNVFNEVKMSINNEFDTYHCICIIKLLMQHNFKNLDKLNRKKSLEDSITNSSTSDSDYSM